MPPQVHHKSLTAAALTAAILIVSCTDERGPTQIEVDPSMEILDGAHDGNERFYFLPPLVPDPPVDGVFDATLEPVVEICAWTASECGTIVATFSMVAGPGGETVRLDAEGEQYRLNWHTSDFDLDTDVTYRIAISVAGTGLGHADVDVVSSGKELKNVNTGAFIPLKDGRTLPISFRIEVGAVFVVDENATHFVARDGRVTMTLPEGAVPLGTELGVTVDPIAPTPETDVAQMIPGAIWEFGPDGTVFVEPVELMLAYDEDNLPVGLDEASLQLFTLEAGGWLPLPSVVDVDANTVTGLAPGFSAKAIGGPISAGGNHGCAIDAGGVVHCWGSNGRGEAGNGTVGGITSPGPVASSTLFTSVAVGAAHSCALAIDGSVECWGDNFRGQLGDGTVESRPTPVPVAGAITFDLITAGGWHTCGLSGEQGFCWGDNYYGALGAGFNTRTTPYGEVMPVPVAGGIPFSNLEAGEYHTCALDLEGRAYCWGIGGQYQLGNGDQIVRNVPTPVATSGTYVELALGDRHSCARTDAGEVHCWGENSQGQGGVPGFGRLIAPTPVSGVPPLVSITAGMLHTCGLSEEGAAYCWGYNVQGQLGLGFTSSAARPSAVATTARFGAIVAGRHHTCAVALDEEVHCWGYNYSGNLGSTGPDSPSPVVVEALPPIPPPAPDGPPAPTSLLTSWGSQGFGPGQFHNPRGITVVGGEVFVTDLGGQRVQVFDTDGGYLREWGIPSGTFAPADVSFGFDLVDDQPVYYVANRSTNQIGTFGLDGTYENAFGAVGGASGQFRQPVAIVVEGPRLWIADQNNHRVQRFERDPGWIWQGDQAALPDGAWTSIGQNGGGDGEFRNPFDLAVGGGFVFVADGNNYRIQKFDLDGKFLAAWGSQGDGPGQFDAPRAVAVRGARVYVTESPNPLVLPDEPRVQVFDLDGNFVAEWGGSLLSEPLESPRGIAIGGDGSIYVTDFTRNRVHRFAAIDP